MENIDHLRMIANPYRLVPPRPPESSEPVPVSHDDALLRLLQEKYQGIYLNPWFLKTILQTIDRMVTDNERERLISEMVDRILHDAITDTLRHDEIHIPVERPGDV